MLSRRQQKLERKRVLSDLSARISTDKVALSLLARSADPRPRADLVEILSRHFAALKSTLTFGDIFAEFLGWCGDACNNPGSAIHTAMEERKDGYDRRRLRHRDIVRTLRLQRWSNEEKVDLLKKTTREIHVSPLKQAYPPYKHWVYESKTIERRWREHIEEGAQSDKRHTRLPLHREDKSRLSHIIEEDDSVLIRDARTGEIVAVVIRNFCEDEEILSWVNGVVEDVVGLKKSVRKEDPGKLVTIGYTAGFRSKPHFDWARDLRSKKHTSEFIGSKDFASSSVFALFWNMIRARMPAEMLDDFDDYLKSNNMCRMDSNQKSGKSTGQYMLRKGAELIEFDDEELAPPAGLLGCNYARAIHKENQPHRFAFSWTTGRQKGRKAGGHFYLAHYGIKIISTANTFIAWNPRKEHGTSLMDRDPGDDGELPFLQSGMCEVTSMRLAKIWRRYQDAEISLAMASQEYADDLEDDVEK